MMSKKIFHAHEIVIFLTALVWALVGLSSASAVPISDEYVLGPTTPGKWGSPVFGTGATISWSLMPTGTLTLGDYTPDSFKHI